MLRSPREGLLLFWGIQALAFGSVLVPSGPLRPGWYFAALGFAGFVAVPGLAHSAGAASALVPGGAAALRDGGDRVPHALRVDVDRAWLSAAAPAAVLGLLRRAVGVLGADSRRSGVAQGIMGLANHDDAFVLTRLMVFWVALLVMIGLAAHALRARLQSTVTAAEEEARQSAVVAEATRALTAPLDPALVINAATRLAAELVAPPGQAGSPGPVLHGERRRRDRRGRERRDRHGGRARSRWRSASTR